MMDCHTVGFFLISVFVFIYLIYYLSNDVRDDDITKETEIGPENAVVIEITVS